MKLTAIEIKEISEFDKLFSFNIQFKNRTFLVTGAGGMTGSGIVKWLLYLNEKYDANIKVISSTRHPEILPEYVESGDNISFCGFGEETDYLGKTHVDYIIHGAAPTGREFFINNPVETIRIIVDETEKLLELAKKNPGCRFLYMSSMDIYGPINVKEPVQENYVGGIDADNIRNGYPLGKKCAEFLCHAYHSEYGVDTVVVRPASIQGLFQKYSEPRIFNEILRCIIENRNLVMKSDGMSKKCFIYTLDVISAVFTILLKGETNEVYNISNPDTFITIRDLAERIFERFCPDINIEFDIAGGKNAGYLPTFGFVQDITKLENLGWKPCRNIYDIYSVDIERFEKR